MTGDGAKFKIVYAPEAISHLDSIDRKHHSESEDAINEQLEFFAPSAYEKSKSARNAGAV